MKRRRQRARGLGYNRSRGFGPATPAKKRRAKETSALARKNCPLFQRKVNEAIADVPSGRFQPLFFHVISLAEDAASRGSCKQAYREIGQAKRIGRKYPPKRDED